MRGLPREPVVELLRAGDAYPIRRNTMQFDSLLFHVVVPHRYEVDGAVNQAFVREVVPARHAKTGPDSHVRVPRVCIPVAAIRVR